VGDVTEPVPVVYLLTGLPGSGKTTYAKALQRKGVVRLSVDEQVIARHGRLGKDYPAAEHLALLGAITDEVQQQLAALIQDGQSVVLDHGLGSRADRDAYKRLVTQHGGRWRLIHFRVERADLLQRLAKRNTEADSGLISEETLNWITEHSEEPVGEGEEPPDTTLT
jgi:predicted kinase